MRETDLPHSSKFWEMRRYEYSYTLILWMSYLFARKKVTRMNACFRSMAKTVLPFGGSVFVCSSNRVMCGKRFITRLWCMYEIPLRPITTVALFSISFEPMWDLWWTEWYWYSFSPSTSVSSSNYHSTNAPYSSYHSYTSDDVYELSIWQHQDVKIFPCCNRCCQ